jgi:hypothetical protein
MSEARPQLSTVGRVLVVLLALTGLGAALKLLANLRAPESSADDDQVQRAEPKRDKEFPQRFVPRVAVPRPYDGGQDAVAGIESIVVAGTRYWFAFSHRADAVLSPLISDERIMAQFGSDYLLQTDGAHPPEYWLALVERAVRVSELTDNDSAARAFTGFEVRDALREVEAARLEERTARNVALPHHLTYLLHAATETVEEVGPFPCAGDWEQPYKQLDNYGNCRDGAMRVVSGQVAPPAGTDYDDALEVISQYAGYWRRNVPENWRTILLSE